MADNGTAQPLYLYLVTSDVTDDYDTFHEGVVYATSPSHAKAIVLDLCHNLRAPDRSGSWMPLANGAQLTARRLSVRPGAVMGYSRAG